MSQLFGDRMVVANATGCSSIYGGNLPTTPWTTDAAGRGPAWANSLFEDNAEFGLGMRLALDQPSEQDARLLVTALAPNSALVAWRSSTPTQSTRPGSRRARRVAELRSARRPRMEARARRVGSSRWPTTWSAPSVWIVGGDGWAYDIGFGGLDHVLASGRDVNILVLDTEVYSNTGGQASKATPRAAVAKFAAGGKTTGKKDLARSPWLRQRLRGPGRDGRQHDPDGQGVRRGRGTGPSR
jgi:pyruvate-ferredoxin/flavodoxin oxidoreductase